MQRLHDVDVHDAREGGVAADAGDADGALAQAELWFGKGGMMRKLELETEAQILFKHQADAQHRADFDPLELDRYSTIQQLSRALTPRPRTLWGKAQEAWRALQLERRASKREIAERIFDELLKLRLALHAAHER